MVFDYSDSSERKTFVVSYCYFRKCSAMSMVPLLSYLVGLYAVSRIVGQPDCKKCRIMTLDAHNVII